MSTAVSELSGIVAWESVSTGDSGVAVAERAAIGTSARLAVWPPASLGRACKAVDKVLYSLDIQASRFRPDSELSRVNKTGAGLFLLSDGLAEASGVALAAARWTGGLADPTVGDALIALGYDRDFAEIDQQRHDPPDEPAPAPGWQRVRLDGVLLRLPAGVRLDLGATAKGVGADRAARAVMSVCRTAGGVLVSLGGDISVAGTPPGGGWPITVADGPVPDGSRCAQLVRLTRGAVATSSVTCRQWRRGGQLLHHIVDPRTGLPAGGPWRTVSTAAQTCADANAATTAAIVAGDQAAAWLGRTGLPARLVARDGTVLRLGGWPAAEGATLPVPRGGHVYGGTRLQGGWR